MYIDTHSHLNFKAFNDDYKDAIERAFNAGVKGIINVGSNLETSEKAIEIAQQNKKGVYAAIGLHPIHVADEKFDYNGYLKLAKDPKVVAIGETGLDYYHLSDNNNFQFSTRLPSRQVSNFQSNSNDTISNVKKKQKEVFEKSLEIAQKVNKPVIIHSREADNEVLKVLQTQKSRDLKAVLHCFGRDWATAKEFLNLGLMLSFTGNITYHFTPEREEMLKKVPLDRIMIETDCPFMVPQTQRDQDIKRNEPAYVIEVAKKIAEIKKLPLEEVEKQTTKNAIRFFNLGLK